MTASRRKNGWSAAVQDFSRAEASVWTKRYCRRWSDLDDRVRSMRRFLCVRLGASQSSALGNPTSHILRGSCNIIQSESYEEASI
jgi:hypothetical protein